MNEMDWYVALCEDCEPVLPQPFRDRVERDTWADKHRTATGHMVTQYATSQPVYDRMISRTGDGPDPLVQEPKK